MGLAASQGRFLCLTARMNDLVYEGQQISQQRMALADEQSAIARNYTEAMGNKIMQCTTPEGGTQILTYDILTNQDPATGLCMRIVDLNGNVVTMPKTTTLNVTTKDENGNDVSESFTNSKDFISKYMSDLSEDEKNQMSLNSLSSVVDYFNQNYDTSAMTLSLYHSTDSTLKNENERYLFDENCTDPKYLQEMLTTGQWLLQKVSDPNTNKFENIVWQGNSAIQEVYDTSDDAAAEAEYEAAMMELNKKDKLLELRLEDIQTQEQSVEKQIDSIKDVIKSNIEDTYKTFA